MLKMTDYFYNNFTVMSQICRWFHPFIFKTCSNKRFEINKHFEIKRGKSINTPDNINTHLFDRQPSYYVVSGKIHSRICASAIVIILSLL